MLIAAKSVLLDFSEWIAENVAADIVKIMNLAITSLDCVVVVVRMDIMGLAVMIHAWTDTTAATVLLFVLLIVRRADTRTDCVPVKQDGQDLTVQQHVEKDGTVSTVVNSVQDIVETTLHVIT